MGSRVRDGVGLALALFTNVVLAFSGAVLARGEGLPASAAKWARAGAFIACTTLLAVGLARKFSWLDRWGNTAVRTAAGGVLAVGVLALATAPLSPERLSAQLDGLKVDGAQMHFVSTSGNGLCLDTCPTATRVYRVPGPVDPVRDAFVRALAAKGYRLGPFERSRDLTQWDAEGAKGDVEVAVRLTPSGFGPPASQDGQSAEQVMVEVTLRAT